MLVSLALLLFPESPMWLMQHGQEENARRSLRWHRPYPGTKKIEEEIRDIMATLEQEDQTKRSASPFDMFRDKVQRL